MDKIMGTYNFILTILKYFGLFGAAFSSLLAMTNVVSIERAGKKYLTRAGKILISITITGFVISVASNILQDHIVSQTAQYKATDELKRMNRIILAGQPLTSLKIKWKFNKVNKVIQNFIDSCEHKIETDLTGPQEYSRNSKPTHRRSIDVTNILSNFDVLYPFLNIIPLNNIQSTDNLINLTNNQKVGVVAIIPLDNGANALLPIGEIDSFSQNAGPIANRNEPYGLRYNSDVFSKLQQKETQNAPSINYDSIVEIIWDLNPTTFFSSIDKKNDISISASLPSLLKITILSSIKLG
jgi:hypothetical protein